MLIELINRFSKTITVEVTVGESDVVFLLGHEIVANWHRQQLFEWLCRPTQEITSKATTLMAVPNGVALAIEDVTLMWPLADDAVTFLLDSIEPRSAASSHTVRGKRTRV